MRVVFLEDVAGVAQGGDVKEVKNGFARNYLIPQKLAVPAAADSLQRVERLTKNAEDQRIKTLNDMKALGEALDGKLINVEMRAGASGRLYGSVTNAIVADELSKITAREIDRRTIELAEPVRQVGLHDIRVRLHSDVDVNIKLLVYPAGSDPVEVLESIEEAEKAEEEGAEQAEAGETGTDEGAEDSAEEAAEEAPDDEPSS